MYTWRTDEHGFICVTTDGVERIPVLDEKSAAAFRDRVLRWEDLAREACEPRRVSLATMMGTIYSESLGNPKAINWNDNPNGLGLTQITALALYREHTREQVLDPKTNLELAAIHYRTDLLDHAIVGDEPSLASMFNAGCAVGPGGKLRPHPSTQNPWGMRCYGSYITTRVAAHNYYLNLSRPIPGIADPYSDERVLAEGYLMAWDLVGDAIDEARLEAHDKLSG